MTTTTRCWICRDGLMWITNEREMDGLPACKCDTCGAFASALDTARHQKIGEVVSWITRKIEEIPDQLT